MERITLYLRTQKTKGIKLRFRLTDGREIQLFHKSEIIADLSDLSRFTDYCQLKPRTTVYNRDLFNQIQEEVSVMETVYRKHKKDGDHMLLTSEDFEKEIGKTKNPEIIIRDAKSSLLVKFLDSADRKFKDDVIGLGRYRHSIVLYEKLKRFLTINHKLEITPEEVTPELLMDFRQFITEEYKYVKKYKELYSETRSNNIPTKELGHNTVVVTLNHLQAFFTELEDMDEIVKSPFRKLGKERKKVVMAEHYDEPVYLVKEEFQKVLHSDVPESLKEVKALFLLQCAFGCRINDFKNLSMDSIDVDVHGIPFIHYLPQKTIKTSISDIVTPILPYALEIIKEYQFDFHLLKYVSGKSGYNAKIKQLLKYLEIDRKCTVYDSTTRMNKRVPLYELGSSKLCRKTHVDMMAKAQINEYAAGLHKEGSDAVKRYTSLGLKDRFTLMCVAFEQKMYKVDNELNIIE